MRKYLVMAGAVALAAAWTLPTYAAPPATSTLNSGATVGSKPSSAALSLEQMDRNQPFGDLNIDPTQQPADVYARLNADQRTDLEARCNLIVPNADKFGPSVPTWCHNYLDWRKASYPNE